MRNIVKKLHPRNSKEIALLPEQVGHVESETKTQNESNDSWFKYRKWRITASIFQEVVDEISDDRIVRNPENENQ